MIRLMQLAYPREPADILEQMATWKFIEGVQVDAVGNAFLPNTYSTSSEALGKALDIEGSI